MDYDLWGPNPDQCDIDLAADTYVFAANVLDLGALRSPFIGQATAPVSIAPAFTYRDVGIYQDGQQLVFSAPLHVPKPPHDASSASVVQNNGRWEYRGAFNPATALHIAMMATWYPRHTLQVNGQPLIDAIRQALVVYDPVQLVATEYGLEALLPSTGWYARIAECYGGFLAYEQHVDRSRSQWYRFPVNAADALFHALRWRLNGGMPVYFDPRLRGHEQRIEVQSLTDLQAMPIDTLIGVCREEGHEDSIAQTLVKSKDAVLLKDRLRLAGIETLFDLIMHYPTGHTAVEANKYGGQNTMVYGVISNKTPHAVKVLSVDGIEWSAESLSDYGSNIDRVQVGDWVLMRGATMREVDYGIRFATFDLWEFGPPSSYAPKYTQFPRYDLFYRQFYYLLDELMARLVITGDGVGAQALQHLLNGHTASSSDAFTLATQSLATIELGSLLAFKDAQRIEQGTDKAWAIVIDDAQWQHLLQTAPPYTLSPSQLHVLEEIRQRLASDQASKTLLSADVGSGKTAVLAILALALAQQGVQTAIVAPTVLLAQQVHAVIDEMAQRVGGKVALAGPKMKAKEERLLKEGLRDGSINIVVGTKKINKFEFHNLGLVGIDEQHKFGVKDREALLTKGRDGLTPHVVMQTATPIPQSMNQGMIGDIAVSIMDAPPSNRKGVVTKPYGIDPKTLLTSPEHPLWDEVRAAINRGEAVFIVAPRIKDVDKRLGVESIYDLVNKHILPDAKVGLLHGRITLESQDAAMTQLRNGELDVLIASVIIEVGIDVPRATHMIIMYADQLGSAQAHQLRGRVGRGDRAGVCSLIWDGATKDGYDRIQTLTTCTRGADVAEADLRRRGPGHILGVAQSGANELRFVDYLSPQAIVFADPYRHANGAADFARDYLKGIGNEELVL